MTAPYAFAEKVRATYPLQRHTFTASHQSGATLDVADAGTLDEAKAMAAHGCRLKEYFNVTAIDTLERRATVYHFRVRTLGKAGFYRPAYDGGADVFVPGHQVEYCYSQSVTAFAPVTPWQWSQDDPTGFKHGRLPANSPLLAEPLAEVRS